MIVGFGVMELIILILFSVLLPLLIFRPIAKKAGYSGWWALMMIIPLVNVIMIRVFAFAKWPVEKA